MSEQIAVFREATNPDLRTVGVAGRLVGMTHRRRYGWFWASIGCDGWHGPVASEFVAVVRAAANRDRDASV